MVLFSAKRDIRKKSKYHDSRLSKREFRDFIYKIVELMGGPENFDFFVEFLLNSVEVGRHTMQCKINELGGIK